MIITRNIGTRCLQRPEEDTGREEVEEFVISCASAVRSCAQGEVFEFVAKRFAGTREIWLAGEERVYISKAGRFLPRMVSRLVPAIMRRFEREDEQNLYGLEGWPTWRLL